MDCTLNRRCDRNNWLLKLWTLLLAIYFLFYIKSSLFDNLDKKYCSSISKYLILVSHTYFDKTEFYDFVIEILFILMRSISFISSS